MYTHDRLSWWPAPISEYVMDVVAYNDRVGIRPNLIRLSFDVGEFQTHPDISNPKDLRKLSIELEKRGIYLAIIPHTINGRIPGVPNDDTVALMDSIASALKDRPNVLFGLWLEPHVEWDEWSSWITAISSAILKHFPQEHRPIIIVSGTNWARDFRGANIPLPMGSYMVNVDYYPWQNDPAHPDQPVWNWFSQEIGNVPVLIGEIGGNVPAGMDEADYWGSDDDIDFITRVFKIIDDPKNKGLIHVTMWRGDGREDGTVSNVNGPKITRRGQALKDSMKANPPTDFTRPP